MDRKQDLLEVKIIRVALPLLIYEGILLCIQCICGIGAMVQKFGEMGNSDTNTYQLAYHLFDNTAEWIQRYQLVMLFIAAVITMGILAFIWKKEDRNFFGVKETEREEADFGIRMGAMIVLAGIFSATGLSRLLYLLPLDNLIGSNQEVNQTFYSNPMLFQILTLCFATPIVEELIFRGMMYQRLCEYAEKRTAIVMTSIVFGLYHGNLVQGIYAGILGFIACLVYERCHTLRASILLHMAANTTALVAAYVPVSADISAVLPANLAVMMAELLGLGVCVYLIGIFQR